jgi:hypothetical protein
VAAPSQPIDRTVGVVAFSTLADTLVHGFFDNSYFLLDAALIWWLIAALVAQATEHTHAVGKVRPNTSRTMGAELPL